MAKSLRIDEKERLAERAIAAASLLQSDVTGSGITNEPISLPAADAVAVFELQGSRNLVSGNLVFGLDPVALEPLCPVAHFAESLGATDPLFASAHRIYSYATHVRARRSLAGASNATFGPLMSCMDDLTSFGIITSVGGDEAAASDHPFERLDERHDEGARSRGLLERAWHYLPTKYRDRLVSRVRLLALELDEDEPGHVPSAESLQNMLAFLVHNPSLRFPDIVLTPDGRFRAEWHKSKDQHLAVTFLPDGEARYVVFAKRPGARLSWPLARVDRQSGVTSIDRLMGILAPFVVRRWVEE